MVDLKDLDKLKSEMPYKWREQSVNERGATMIAYIDARQLFDKLDEVCGVGNWQSDFRLVDGKLYGGIGIYVDRGDHGGWVWKWDVGSESNVEKEKGESSDALKRAGIHWGVGRFLYSLGIVTLRSAQYNGKWKPADDSGNIIWDRDKLTELCKASVDEGKLDRTKLAKTASKQATPTATKPQAPLPYLNKDTKEWTTVSTAVKDGKATMEYVESKFRLSKPVKEELTSLLPKKG